MATVRRRWVIAVAMVLGSFVLGAAVAWTSLRTPFVFGGAGGGLADKPRQFFTIEGDLVEPMWPGGFVPLDLVVTNPLETDLGVSRLLVEIDEIDAPNATESQPCDVHDFEIVQLTGFDELIVEAGATTTLTDLGVPLEAWPRVHMLDGDHNQDGCKNATFSLAYSAVGRIVE
jgi:hypothetical protein